jgi:hypothetical protein
MATTDPRIDAYIAKQGDFARPILTWIRAQMHAASPDIGEAIKWGMPFFTYQDRPLANMAAFKAHASFGFWDRAGMATGKEGEAMGQYGRLTSLADLPPEAEFCALVQAALAPIAAGDAPKRVRGAPKPDLPVPDALAQALADDALATATWDGFPPGCRREYSEWIGEAKRPETRDKRVAQTIAQLREGKKMNWKYESC